MVYREYRPSSALRPVVDRLWSLVGPAAAIGAEPIPPDGHAEIIVHAGVPFAEQREDGMRSIQDRVLFAGQATRAVRLHPRGDTRIVGARLRPEGAHLLLGVPQGELVNCIIDLRSLHGPLARRLRDDVAAREDGDQLVMALDRALRALAPRAVTRPSHAEAAVAHAQTRRGLVRVPDLAAHAGVSVRQLERIFDERIGVTPKVYLRILRFQQVLRALRDGRRGSTWAALALSHGYYDQSHFIRDFTRFVGLAPNAAAIGHESLTAVFSAIRRDERVAFFQDDAGGGA